MKKGSMSYGGKLSGNQKGSKTSMNPKANKRMSGVPSAGTKPMNKKGKEGKSAKPAQTGKRDSNRAQVKKAASVMFA